MWVVIDGNNWYSRAWFALKPTTSTDPEIVRADMEERCVRAVQTVLDWIEDTARQLKPETLAICWDSPNSFRREMFPEYKGGRGEKPEGYYAAMAVLRQNLDSYLQVESSGYEADDLLAKFAIDAVKANEQCLLCSSDKDLHQCLITGAVSQCISITRSLGQHFGRLEFKVVTADLLFNEYGVKPSQWVDFRCMVGDKSDGLAGALGIGEKLARKILDACETLDGFYADPDKAPIAAGKRSSLLEFKSQVPLMRKLVTLPLRPETLRNPVPA